MTPPRAVFDAVVFVQALISGRGPAAACVQRALDGEVVLFLSDVATPPKVFVLPRDPKDEPYTDLATAANAACLVTWNERHLTYLMQQDTPEGKEFCQRFPCLKIMTPPAFLRALADGGQA